jgi:hypothetical protein
MEALWQPDSKSLMKSWEFVDRAPTVSELHESQADAIGDEPGMEWAKNF